MVNFIICILLLLIMFYAPGFLFVRNFAPRGAYAVAFAPLISIALYEIFAIVFSFANIENSFFALFAPALLLGVACFFAFRKQCAVGGQSKADLKMLALYACVGLGVGAVCFIANLPDVNSFCQEWDNASHLSFIRSFLETGDYSTLGVSAYGNDMMTPSGEEATSFYPAAWHLICAMIVSLTGFDVTLVVNAENYFVAAVVFQTSMFAFMTEIFGKNRNALFSGAFFSNAFVSFPWVFLVWGPIYPNLLAFALLPAAMLAFIVVLNRILANEKFASVGLIFLISCFTLAICQTNSIFAAIILLWPLFAAKLAKRRAKRSNANNQKRIFVIAYIFMFFVLFLLWLWMYFSPIFASLYQGSWYAIYTKPQAFLRILDTSMRGTLPNIVLAICVLVGFICACKDEEKRWLAVSYFCVCFMFLMSTTQDGRVKQFLTGIWYTDPYRVAAICTLAAIVLASWGGAKISEFASRHFAKKKAFRSAKPAHLASVMVLTLLLISSAWPFYDFSGKVQYGYSNGEAGSPPSAVFLDADEREFLKKVAEITNVDNSLVINEPFDGSVFAYALNDINVFYRSLRDFDYKETTPENILIHERLYEVATNQDVKDAVDTIGAKYVLLLDCESRGTKRGMHQYYKDWTFVGIASIYDHTKGFETVLSEGDMRLYKIVA